MSGKKEERVRGSTRAALWLLIIRSTAGCLGQALSQSQRPSRSTEARCPANPTLHIALLDRSRREVAVQGLMCFPFQADVALLDA